MAPKIIDGSTTWLSSKLSRPSLSYLEEGWADEWLEGKRDIKEGRNDIKEGTKEGR
jgi:hypothetical protein